MVLHVVDYRAHRKNFSPGSLGEGTRQFLWTPEGTVCVGSKGRVSPPNLMELHLTLWKVLRSEVHSVRS